MPVKGLKRHFDKESGQMIEGMLKPRLILPTFTHSVLVDVEYIFADDERQQNPAAFKFLQMAHMWKKNQGDKPALPGFAAASSKPKDDSDSESEDESDASSENND